MNYSSKSFWLSTVDIDLLPSLEGEHSCDVAIVGGGYTGLSTAYFLKKFDPDLDVVILEKECVGFGASGRNAGFSMKLFGFSMAMTALRFGKENAVQAHHYMTEAVSLVRELVEKHEIDCDYEHSGFFRIATSEAYERRIRKEIDFAHANGVEDIEWWDAARLADEVRSPLFRGAAWEPDSAILNPAKLVRGLKDVVEAMGVRIYEQTPVVTILRKPALAVETPGGKLKAERLVLATNAYSHFLPVSPSRQAPAFTYVVLTEPLQDRHFDAIGWKSRQGLEDARNMIHYFRLTADNRLLMGGSDVSVPFGQNMDLDLCPPTFARIEENIRALFPALNDVSITHRWGGPVSITLDMAPALGFASDERILYSVGCTGHGVSLTHLNGRTLAELALGMDTERTSMFFVNRTVPPWPPEPLRYAASRAVRGALRLQDRFTDP
ncbi:MAG: NAD(P)/FAD-dependent oxidoreductase [Bradymonadaceae bacterium]